MSDAFCGFEIQSHIASNHFYKWQKPQDSLNFLRAFTGFPLNSNDYSNLDFFMRNLSSGILEFSLTRVEFDEGTLIAMSELMEKPKLSYEKVPSTLVQMCKKYVEVYILRMKREHSTIQATLKQKFPQETRPLYNCFSTFKFRNWQFVLLAWRISGFDPMTVFNRLSWFLDSIQIEIDGVAMFQLQSNSLKLSRRQIIQEEEVKKPEEDIVCLSENIIQTNCAICQQDVYGEAVRSKFCLHKDYMHNKCFLEYSKQKHRKFKCPKVGCSEILSPNHLERRNIDPPLNNYSTKIIQEILTID